MIILNIFVGANGAANIPPSIDQTIGAALRRYRSSAGNTEDDVATLLKISPTRVSEFEAGKKRINANQLFAIAKFFDVPVAALFNANCEAL
jgi:transcriptional regulator with XRE-family HTH domain